MRLFRMLSIAAGLVLMVGLLTAGYVDNPNAKHADGMTIGNTYYTEPVIVTNEPNGTVNLNNMGKMKFITRPEYNLLSPVYMLRRFWERLATERDHPATDTKLRQHGNECDARAWNVERD